MAILAVVGPGLGCGGGEPQVASDVPQIKVVPIADPPKNLKGAPKDTPKFKFDPASGRPLGIEPK